MNVKEQTINIFISIDRLVETLRYNKKLLVGVTCFLAILSLALSTYLFSIPYPKLLGEYEGCLPPSAEHFLGTDNYGRDIVQVLLYGTQLSLLIGFVAGIIGTSISIAVGFISGYRGGLTDDILRSVVDVFLVVPSFPILALCVIYLRGLSILSMSVILGVFSWPGAARLIRSQMLTLKERDFVDLAKISRLNQVEILIEEILPNMIPYLAITFVGCTIGAIYAEVGLEVIGLGTTNANTLGFIFHEAIKNLAVLHGWWWWIGPPTACLVGIFASLYLITLGLDEIANPRLKKITGL